MKMRMAEWLPDWWCSAVSLHQDDKKFYQLELVNRETNFNKVFNASPNVGVINPLIKVGLLFVYFLCGKPRHCDQPVVLFQSTAKLIFCPSHLSSKLEMLLTADTIYVQQIVTVVLLYQCVSAFDA